MSSIRDLVQLQELDTALSAKRTQLSDIQRRMAETQAIDELTQRRDALRAELARLQREAREADVAVQDTRTHLGSIEAKLYGGQVRNPKELVALQQDADMVRGQLARLEEASLAAMGRLEEAQRALAEAEAELARATAEHQALVAELSAQKSVLDAAVAELEARRSAVVARVPPADLRVYTTVYASRQGRAVAKVERTVCQGCRVNLPAVVVHRLRSNANLVQCPSCGRILYA